MKKKESLSVCLCRRYLVSPARTEGRPSLETAQVVLKAQARSVVVDWGLLSPLHRSHPSERAGALVASPYCLVRSFWLKKNQSLMSHEKSSEVRDPATQCWSDCANAPLLTCASCGISAAKRQSCQVQHWKRGKAVCKRKGIGGLCDLEPTVGKTLQAHRQRAPHGGVAEVFRVWMAVSGVD
jgi:hypothetical protein